MIDAETLATMRSRLRPNTRWAAYQNAALDSAGAGEICYLHVGEGCTYAEAPPHYPDTSRGAGWKYVFHGWVNFDTGAIEKG
jgi:hypothetical protein